MPENGPVPTWISLSPVDGKVHMRVQIIRLRESSAGFLYQNPPGGTCTKITMQ